jgi:hypothetical protein
MVEMNQAAVSAAQRESNHFNRITNVAIVAHCTADIECEPRTLDDWPEWRGGGGGGGGARRSSSAYGVALYVC